MADPEIIAGEMRLWSDLSAVARPAPGGPVLVALAGPGLRGATRVLVAGPHDDDVLAAVVATGAEVTVVVRALSDAERIAGQQPGVRVVCGGLDAFEAEPFDAVVALDGVERVLSNDSAWQSWGERLDGLAARVASGGRLLLALDNPHSVESFADARPPAERRDAGDWEPPTWVDRTRPATLAQLQERLDGLGLAGPAYAALPRLTRPVALVRTDGTGALAGLRSDLRLRHAVRAGSRLALADRELLFDPTPQLLAALEAGGGDVAAAGWVLVLGRGADSGGASDDLPADLPVALWLDQPGRPGAAVLAAGAEGATTVASSSASHDEAAVRRDSEPSTSAPAGQPLDRLLAGLALAEDLPALRELVRQWLQWVGALAGTEPGRAALATPENVVLDGDAFSLLDDSWQAVGDIGPEVALTRVALAAADLLLHPEMRPVWPPWVDGGDLARSLLAMAGIQEDAATWPVAEDLHVRLREAEAPAVLDRDLRSLRAVNEVLGREIWTLHGQLHAHERLAEHRNRQLENKGIRIEDAERRAAVAEVAVELSRRETTALRDSVSFRLGRALRHPAVGARAVYRRLRRDRG